MSSDEPLISVCIANYNGAAVLDECIQSVMDQAVAGPIEIIVHDDASTDGSAIDLCPRYPQVRLLQADTNVGFCVANNRMVSEARGKYVLLLNNDAALLPDSLASLLIAATENGGPAIYTLPQFDAATGDLLDLGSHLDFFFNPIPNRNARILDVAMVMGACLWMPRQLWRDLGGFPEWFGSIGEDLYLCCRARLAGYPVRALANAGYRHRVGFSFGGGKVAGGKLVTSSRRRALSERNKSFVMFVTCPGPWLIPLFMMHVIALCCEGLVLTLMKPRQALWTSIYWAALVGLWRERSKLWQLRIACQTRRTASARSFFRPFRWMPYKFAMLVRHGLPTIH
jgi:GT2 family glycosyltransferase